MYADMAYDAGCAESSEQGGGEDMGGDVGGGDVGGFDGDFDS